MKNIKFNIKKLGAIHNSTLELSPLMVFSGESGLGKSYAAFLVHYLYILLLTDRMRHFFKKEEIDLNSLIQGKGAHDVILKIQSSVFLGWVNKDAISYIGYLLGDENLTGDVEIDIPLEDELIFFFDVEKVGIDKKEEWYYKFSLENLPASYRIPANSENLNADPLVALLAAKLLGEIFTESLLTRTFLMPPSRGSLVELSDRPAFRSGMYDEFFDNKLALNRSLKEATPPSETILKCLNEINGGELTRIEGREMYRIEGEANLEIPVTAAASSIKELAPLTLFLKKYPADESSILLEEPEAHLHPTRQVKVADLVGCAIQEGCHMQITTHSDYFLRRINNLMMAFQLKNRDPEHYKQFKSKWNLVDECLIDPANVNAYLFQRRKDGSTEIIKQDISNDGIPFDSFFNVIEEDILTSRELRKALQ
ncbi:AAA family ATPase [Bacteroides sp. 519]|uniref:AAA family ATPase n=1 Tax=Bacteroides sp. 519 TaxID=2302937 RepID=UPI0013D37995|nr:AAA family ATPase [Bacteroides sp. 519]